MLKKCFVITNRFILCSVNILAFALLRCKLCSPAVCPVGNGSAHFLKQVPRRCNLRTTFGPERLAYTFAPAIIHIFADRPLLFPPFPSSVDAWFFYITRELHVYTHDPRRCARYGRLPNTRV